MGPAINKKFTSLGYRVKTGTAELITQSQIEQLVEAAGPIDILVANLALPPHSTPVQDIPNDAWQALFDALVHPLMYLVRAVTPKMLERQSGKIIAVTSAAPLKGIPNNAALLCSSWCAKMPLSRQWGWKLARNNIQVNAIAQNYINNDTYYPDELLQNEKFLQHVKKNVPTNKVGSAEETAELAAYLASDSCNHMVAQIIPLAGGWAT